MPDTTRRSLGQWCADVEAAPDYEAYLDLLYRAPAEMQDAIIRHCQTAAAHAQASEERQAQRRKDRAALRRQTGLGD